MSRPTISRKIKAWEIGAIKVGNRNRIPYEEFERYWRKTVGDLVELTRVLLDANIIAKPVTRTVLIVAPWTGGRRSLTPEP